MILRKTAVAIATAILAGFSGGSLANDVIRVGKASAETFAFAPVHIGHELGIFERHGITVEISDFGGGARAMQGLAAGAVDIALVAGPEIAAVALGNPSKAVAMFMGPPAMLVILTNPGSDIQSAEDLRGKKVAITQAGTLTAYLMERVSASLGWGRDGIDLIALGDDRTRLAALRIGQVDAIVINTATALRYEQEGEGRIVTRFGDYVGPFHNHVTFATEDLINRNPDAVRAFNAGWLETIAWMHEHREETVEMTKAMQGVDTATGLAVYDEAMPAFSTDLRFDDDALQLLLQSWMESGILTVEPDLKTLYTEEYL